MKEQPAEYPKQIIVIFVTWKRRKGQPTEMVAVTTGGLLQALFLERETAKRLKVPSSWTNFRVYNASKKRKR